VSPASTLSSGGSSFLDLQVVSDAGGDSVAVWYDGSSIWGAEQPAGGSWTSGSQVASTAWGIGATDSVGISSSGTIYVFVGKHTFTVVAISKDGQKTTRTVTYTVKK
jgi:hypothetical protein